MIAFSLSWTFPENSPKDGEETVFYTKYLFRFPDDGEGLRLSWVDSIVEATLFTMEEALVIINNEVNRNIADVGESFTITRQH